MFVPYQYLGVSFLYDRVVFVLDIHFVAHVSIRGRHGQPVDDALHVSIVFVHRVIDGQQAAVVLVAVRLVEDAQHPFEAVVDVSVQARNLDDDAVMCQAVHERVGQSLGDDVPVVVARLLVDIQYGFFDAAHLMA